MPRRFNKRRGMPTVQNESTPDLVFFGLHQMTLPAPYQSHSRPTQLDKPVRVTLTRLCRTSVMLKVPIAVTFASGLSQATQPGFSIRSAPMICTDHLTMGTAVQYCWRKSRFSISALARSRCASGCRAEQRTILPSSLVTQLGPRVSHSRNCAAPAWICGASCGTARAASGTGAKTRIRWGARARTRYAGARSLLTSHGTGCPRMTLGPGCLLSHGRSARSCD